MREKIYLLPGLMTDKRVWQRMMPYLEEKYELIHIDIPLSSDFDVIVDTLDELFKSNNDEKVNLFGFSFGAYIASYYSVKYPNKVNKLFLLSGTPSKMTDEEIEKRNSMIELLETLGFNGLSEKRVVALLEEKNHNDTELIKLIQNMYADLGVEVYKAQIQTINNRIPLEKQLIELTKTPITLFYSTEDRLLNYGSLKNFNDTHKHITQIKREGISHMLPLEEPKLVCDAIEKWMSK